MPGKRSVSDRIDEMQKYRLQFTWSVMLGQILKLDQIKARATVRPLMKIPTAKGQEPEGMKEIYFAPVNIDRAGPFYTRRPYEVGEEGDIVVMLVHDRALDNLVRYRKQQDPKHARAHSLEDVIVMGSIRANTDYLLTERYQKDWILEHMLTGSRVVITREDGTIIIQAPRQRQIQLGVDATERICLEDLAEDFYNHVHTDPQGGVTSPPTNRRPWQTEYVSNLVVSRKQPVDDSEPLVRGPAKQE